mgnify:CR=1 FL=1
MIVLQHDQKDCIGNHAEGSAEGAVGVLLQQRNPLRKETEADREPQHVAEVAGEKAVRESIN